MVLDVGMDRKFFGAQTSAKPPNSQFVCKLFSLVSQNFQNSDDMMMPKMFVVLALLAHGAVAVRSNTWLSEGQLELEKVEKKPPFVGKILKPARSLKGWTARKLGKKKNEEKEVEKREIAEEIDEEKLVDYVQKRVVEEVGTNATPHQVEVLIRTVRAKFPMVKDWTEVQWGALGVHLLQMFSKFYLPLDVTASAVAFCGDLVKAVISTSKQEEVTAKGFPGNRIEKELVGAEKLCSQVLTGNLSKMSSAPKWAVEAAQVAEMDDQQHPYGRLDGVAWKHSLKRVCHDECEELVKGIQDKAEELGDSAYAGNGTVEDACADKVVKHVEAEILGCCSRSCGWNGQFCSFFPFLNSTEQADWQAECCSERNILQGSSRQQLCDSTLSEADKNMSQNLTDQRPNMAKDREILGQDESDSSNSFSLMERSFGGSVDHKTCPTPIDLHKIYKNFFQAWKRMPLTETRQKNKTCEPEDQPSVGECKSFSLMESTDDKGREKYKYKCWDACGWKRPKNPKSLHVLAEKVKDEVLGIGGNLFVHKDIYSAWKWT